MVRKWIKSLKQLNRKRREQSKSQELRSQLHQTVEAVRDALKVAPAKIPVLVVCYNNAVYVRRMTANLQRYGITPIVLDNRSDDPETVNTLNDLRQRGDAHVVTFPKNFGHMVGFLPPIYEVLPEVFAYTDPDIDFSPTMPATFLEDLAELTSRYIAFKAGLAMSLDAAPQLSRATVKLAATEPIQVNRTFSILDGEAPFWRRRLVHETLEVYATKIDTIFAVYRKSNYRGDFFDGIRVGGDYKAIHLPWFPELDPMSHEQKMRYLQGNVSTTWLTPNKSGG